MSSTVLELYLSKRGLVCMCSGYSYVQTAHDGSRLFTLTDSPCFTRGIDRVLRDAHSTPLLHAKTKGWSLKERIDVYKGESKDEGGLAFTIKVSSIFSKTLHIFLAGSPLDGPPDYKLKPATFRNSLKIFRQEEVVATAKQDFIICGCFQPDYTITISPGMDQAMVVLLVAIHEYLRPKSSGGGDGGGGGGVGGVGGGVGGVG